MGSVGVGVFSHLCSVDGLEQSFFIPKEDKCLTVVKEKSCCHKSDTKTESHELSTKKCCSESLAIYKLNTENTDQILKLKFNKKYISIFQILPEILPSIFVKENQIAYTNPDPPRSSGKEILIFKQVFRI